MRQHEKYTVENSTQAFRGIIAVLNDAELRKLKYKKGELKKAEGVLLPQGLDSKSTVQGTTFASILPANSKPKLAHSEAKKRVPENHRKCAIVTFVLIDYIHLPLTPCDVLST
jgi:hypothetical protein